MNRNSSEKSKKSLMTFIVILWLCGLLLPWYTWASSDDSGLALNLYAREITDEDGVSQPKRKFFLGDPIELWVIISNSKAWDINTDPEIQEVELDRYIILKDPTGEKHTLNLKASNDDMPPPVTYGEWQVVPAKALKPGYVRSVYIGDVGALFPEMKTNAGPYEISVSLPVTRYKWTVNINSKLHGVLDKNAWHGNLESEPIGIYVVPPSGGRLKVRVEDLSLKEGRYRDNVPVKVFNTSDINILAPGSAWNNEKPILSGTTNDGGWAVWPPGASCVVQNSYTAIALYQGQWGQAVFETDAVGWDTECDGLLSRTIFFNEQDHEFAIFGLNSIWLRNGVRIKSGDVGAQGNNSTSCVINGYEVALGGSVRVSDALKVVGHRVFLDPASSVWDVEYNTLAGGGEIRGEQETPLIHPIWEDVLTYWPTVFEPVGGDPQPITVLSQDETTKLKPGTYGNVVLGSHASLFLEPGEEGAPGLYHFKNLTLGSHSVLTTGGSVEIKIDGRIESGSAKSTYIGPQTGTGFDAKDVKIFVAGEPIAVLLGQGQQIKANIFAKNGSIVTGEGCVLTGSFIAKDVTIGQKSTVYWAGAFLTGDPGTPEIVLSVEDVSLGVNNYAKLEWRGATSDTVIVKRVDGDGDVKEFPWENYIGEVNTDTDPVGKKLSGKSFTYVVCDVSGNNCSNESTIVF